MVSTTGFAGCGDSTCVDDVVTELAPPLFVTAGFEGFAPLEPAWRVFGFLASSMTSVLDVRILAGSVDFDAAEDSLVDLDVVGYFLTKYY